MQCRFSFLYIHFSVAFERNDCVIYKVYCGKFTCLGIQICLSGISHSCVLCICVRTS